MKMLRMAIASFNIPASGDTLKAIVNKGVEGGYSFI
jgi:hypothetical protein